MQMNLKAFSFSTLCAILLVLTGLEQPLAASEIVTADQTQFSFGTWLLISFSLAIFGFKTRAK
jgi:hypothetical protein